MTKTTGELGLNGYVVKRIINQQTEHKCIECGKVMDIKKFCKSCFRYQEDGEYYD